MPIDAAHIKAVDEAMSDWQQGDAIVDDAPSFVHIADLAKPLTGLALAEVANGAPESEALAVLAASGEGVIVVSQTCDLVRSCEHRPFAQVAALRKVEPTLLKQVEMRARPNFAFVPALSPKQLVADLDRIMTIEKSVLARIPRAQVLRGVNNDYEISAFSECLARRFARFAFPEDFVTSIEAIQSEIKKKHKAPNSKDGKVYRGLREIRVAVSPSWSALQSQIEFLFILKEPTDAIDSLDQTFSALVQKFKPTGAFRNSTYRVVSLLDITADFYLGSERLDLDNLTRSKAIE